MAAAPDATRRWWVLWTVLGGLFAVNVSFTIFAVALPRVARELDTSENTLTWVITGPLLAFGVFAPALGKAGDLFGHRRMYLLGMAGAVVASVLSAMAWSAGSLIAFRTLGAVEGAATGASSMALIFSVFERDDRVKAMGWWSLVGAGGPVIGVALGGPAIELFGWRWIFVAQVPMILAAIVVAAAVLPETARGSARRFDWAGVGTLTAGVTTVLFALNRAPEWGWTAVPVLAGFVFGPACLAAFLWAEGRVSDPLIPPAYLRRRNFAFPIASQVCANFAYMGGFILAPQLLASIFGHGESRIGFIVMTRPLAFSIVAPVAGYLAVRLGERITAVWGSAAVVASMLVFVVAARGPSEVAAVVALVLAGIGLGVSTPSIAATVANSVDESDLGIASAAQQVMAQVGMVSGIQLMKTVQAARVDAVGLAGSFADAYWLGAAVCVFAVVAAAFLRPANRLAPAAA